MYLRCLLLTSVLSVIEAHSYYYQPFSRRDVNTGCSTPLIPHGRARLRQRFQLVRFTCNFRYDLVGNRYSTCRDGQWDTPAPVCVKAGCTPLPEIKNAIPMVLHRGAWVVVFCLPGHKLVGSSVIYCDGYRWNATVPACVDSSAEIKYSCDFEDSDLCGWTQDELHDFDWIRLNKKTPSTFMLTGPSYDHTFGSNGTGYYMYIESTARSENETARLVSPIYDQSVVRDGCFQFFYHMYGKNIGGLRVYQKPESLQIMSLLNMLPEEKQKYILFELWGNQGDMWFAAVSRLRNLNDSFQIIIEGIRGKSFTSDIAIDDVAILHGDKCREAYENTMRPTTASSDSCNGRCESVRDNVDKGGCGCSMHCVFYEDCCLDFMETCVFSSSVSPSDEDISTPPQIPVSEKLIVSSTDISADSSTKNSTTTKKITPFVPKSTTTKLTTTKLTTTTKASSTTKFTTTTTKSSTTTKPTTKPTTTIKSTTASKPSTTQKPTTTLKSTTTSISTTVATKATSPNARLSTTSLKTTTDHILTTAESQNNKKVEAQIRGHSRAGTIAGIVAGVLCITLLGVALVWNRGKGSSAFYRLRGRVTNDTEVRYLTSSIDD